MSRDTAATPAAHATWTSVRGLRGREPSAEAAHVAARLAVDLGAEVRRMREERGWSQAQLAVQSRTSRSTVSRIELGAAPVALAVGAGVASALGADLRVSMTGGRGASEVDDDR
jgi:ribosome-binding protein aMBF1 (putative translation factor)